MALGASQAARFQAYQTRARMGAKLWWIALKWTGVAWIALTFYVVWRQTGVFFPQLQHAYFWHWVIWGILTSIPIVRVAALRCSTYANGEWYPVGQLTDWMNGPQMYNLSFPAWFWHYSARTALPLAAVTLLILVWKARPRVDAEHLRGLRLITPRDQVRALNGGWFIRNYRNLTTEQPGIKLGSITLPRRLEREHFAVLGSTGSGKSTLDRHILYQVRDRGDSAIVYDPDCEYIQEFYDEKRGDIVLNPVDMRCPFWTPWFELRDQFKPIDAAALAASIIRGRPTNDTQEYFQRNARALVRGMFEAIPVKDRDNLEVFADFLKQSRDTLREQLDRTKAPAAIIDPGAHDSGGGTGIIGVTDAAIEGFGYMPRRDQTTRRWSAREYAAEPRGWLFLTSNSTTRDAVQALQGIWLDCLVRWLMDRPFDSPHVWIFADECPAMGYQPLLKDLATKGRKRHLTLVMCAQSISQLREIYGHDGAITLISSPSTKIILRVDESEMAEWASAQLGAREIERLQMTQLSGLSSYREGVNLQPQRSTERIVLADEIKLLPALHGYLCIVGTHRTSITIPERHLDAQQPAFIPRAYDSDAARPPVGASKPLQPGWTI
jgi:type IV secretory pathway TraG/TraD family ATPase VirD4